VIADRTARRRVARGLGALAVALAVWAEGTTPAWATFRKTATASSTVSTHTLLAPTLSCGSTGFRSVTMSWTAPADTLLADVYGTGFLAAGYELARGTTSGGPYPTTVATAVTLSTTTGLANGTYYFVVRTTKNSWRSTNSNQRRVTVSGLGTVSCV
jgi:hypothetical protein